MQALLPSSSICAASRRVSCDGDARSTKAWWFFYTSRFFPSVQSIWLPEKKKKQACLKKPSAFGDFLKIRSPQRSSIFKLEKMGKEPFWRKLPFLRMTKDGRESWCRNSCDTIDIAYVLDICHRSPFILVLSLGPPKSSYLTHPSILLQVPVLPFCNLQKPRLQSSPVISRPHPRRCSPCLHLFSSSIPNDCKTLATFCSFQQNKMNNLYNSIKISNFPQFVTKTWLNLQMSWRLSWRFLLLQGVILLSLSFQSAGRLSHFIHDVDPVTWNSRRVYSAIMKIEATFLLQLSNSKITNIPNIPNTQKFPTPNLFSKSNGAKEP